ncbi:MAG: hypothetical protein ACE5F7_00010 [Nitrospiria bacterium]
MKKSSGPSGFGSFSEAGKSRMTNKQHIKKSRRPGAARRGPVVTRWFRWAPLMILLGFLAACSDTGQHNVTAALASKDGGTAGGPIQGRLEVLVFNEVLRSPIPDAQVFLGRDGARSATTNSQGIATFEEVFGPQDIHVYACFGCADAPFPVLFQNTSFYQVNASRVSVPLAPRDEVLSDGSIEGKVFDVGKDETAFLAVIDAMGGFQLNGPVRSLTHQRIDFDGSSPRNLTFVYAKDLDLWAEKAGVRQNFGETAVLGTVINAAHVPQSGVQVRAEYFNGADAGRAYYFNAAGELDPALAATTDDGRFLFLKLVPNNDVILFSESRGIGVGLRFLRLPSEGSVVFTLPVDPISSTLSLSGRVVAFRPDYREEEEKGPLSGGNIGVPRAVINFSGDTFEESFTANGGVVTAGHYQVSGRPSNSRYVVFIAAGSGFRATYQEVSFHDRPKSNYPLSAVPLSVLTDMVIQARIPDPARADAEGNIPNRLGFLPNHGEILGRVTKKTGALDLNGDPGVEPISNAVLSVTDQAGTFAGKAYAIDVSGNILCAFSENSCQTDASGGFVVLDLPLAQSAGVYTLTARDAAGVLLDRRTLPVYPNSVRLVELVKREVPSPPPPNVSTLTVRGADDTALTGSDLLLIGGGLECTSSCVTDASGNVNITALTEGDYLIRMSKGSGGGEYRMSFPASKRRLGFTAFRTGSAASNEASYNLTFGTGLGPLGPGGRLPFDIFFDQRPVFFETTGTISLPAGFKVSDLKMASMGAVVPQGRVFTGTDTDILKASPGSQYRIRSIQTEGLESFFLGVLAQKADETSSFSILQNLSEIPSSLDVSLPAPPVLLSPGPGAANVGETPVFAWRPGTGPVDLYHVRLEAKNGDRLWQAWVPGALEEITLPPFPEAVSPLLKAISVGEEVTWKVEAFRAAGFSFNEFNRRELAEKMTDRSRARSRFTP